MHWGVWRSSLHGVRVQGLLALAYDGRATVSMAGGKGGSGRLLALYGDRGFVLLDAEGKALWKAP